MTVAIIITLLVGLLLFTAGMYFKLLETQDKTETLYFQESYNHCQTKVKLSYIKHEIAESIREINNIANRLDDNRIGQQERISLSKQLKEIANQLREVKEDVNSND